MMWPEESWDLDPEAALSYQNWHRRLKGSEWETIQSARKTTVHLLRIKNKAKANQLCINANRTSGYTSNVYLIRSTITTFNSFLHSVNDTCVLVLIWSATTGTHSINLEDYATNIN